MAASTHNSRAGSMLRRTVSFNDLYNPASAQPALDSPVADSNEYDTPDSALAEENTSAASVASATSSFAIVRRAVYVKKPYVVKKDKKMKRLIARFIVSYDLSTVSNKVRDAVHRRFHEEEAARDAIISEIVEEEAAVAEYEAAEAAAHRVHFTSPSARLAPSGAGVEKRKRTDDDDALDEELNSKRTRIQDHAAPPATDGAHSSAERAREPTITTQPPAATHPTTPTAVIDTAITESAIASTTPRITTSSNALSPATAAPASPLTAFLATRQTSNTLPVPETSPTRRRRSNGPPAGGPAASTAASANSNNSRLRRRASAPALVVYQGPEPEPEDKPEPPSPSPSPRNNKKRRSSLTAKENRGVRRNAANDPYDLSPTSRYLHRLPPPPPSLTAQLSTRPPIHLLSFTPLLTVSGPNLLFITTKPPSPYTLHHLLP
ncbi:hypothetical protein AURDEDRAFT_179537 [Auricularia subglabra TFB-10046 SS5]|nr:hypothetical protein AURDEDRAFT_179537 [Auricularia subglabra TFB-10046 SS5]